MLTQRWQIPTSNAVGDGGSGGCQSDVFDARREVATATATAMTTAMATATATAMATATATATSNSMAMGMIWFGMRMAMLVMTGYGDVVAKTIYYLHCERACSFLNHRLDPKKDKKHMYTHT